MKLKLISKKEQSFMAEDRGTYEVTRAYHGSDPDSGELITDLSLQRINP